MPRRRSRVLVVHRDRDLAVRIRKQLDQLTNIQAEFVSASDAPFRFNGCDETDIMVLDLSALVPAGFEVSRILQPRSATPPVLLLRAKRGRDQAPNVRWRVSQGMALVEAQLHLALGRTPERYSWLPVRYESAHLKVDLPSTDVAIDGQPVRLSAKEAQVLGLLLARANQVVTRDVLIAELWGYETRSLDVYIRRLRQKLGAFGDQIETVTGFGYRFVDREPLGSSPACRGQLDASPPSDVLVT